MARHVFGSLRQNANPIHKRISVLRRPCMRMVGCKTLKFIARKNHFIDAYRRFLATTSIKLQYIRTLRTDQGGEYINHPMQALLDEHLAYYVVCAKDEHNPEGAAETAENNLHHSARAMMLYGSVPKRSWNFAIAHVAYIHNMISITVAPRQIQNDIRATILEKTILHVP